MIAGPKKRRSETEREDETVGLVSTTLPCGKAAQPLSQQEVSVRLKPWQDLAQTRDLPISTNELTRAIQLIDPETTPEGSPSAITTGARPRYWNKVGCSEMKSALVAAMLAYEGPNRMSQLRESNSFNLPTSDLLINVLESSSFDADTKGLAVLLMLKQPIGTKAVEALKTINASGQKSDFLSASLGVAARRLNNALKSAAA